MNRQPLTAPLIVMACIMLLLPRAGSVQAQPDPFVWQNANREAGTVTSLAGTPLILPGINAAGFTVFAGTDEGGLFRSIDSAENWFPTALQGVFARAVDVSRNFNASIEHRDVVYVATYGDGVWRSENLGGSFTQVFVTTPEVLSLVINNFHEDNALDAVGGHGDVWIGTDGDGVYRSVDNGGTWAPIASGTLTGSARIVRAIDVEDDGATAANKDRIWIGTFGRGVWSFDYGATVWVERNGTAGTLQQAFVNAILVDQIRPGGVAGQERIYAGTNNGLYYSDDAGTTWTLALSGVIVRSISIYTSDGVENLLVGTDDYVYRAVNSAVIANTVKSAVSPACNTTTNAAAHWTQFDGLYHDTEANACVVVTDAALHPGGFQSRPILALLAADIDDDGTADFVFAGTADRGVHRSEAIVDDASTAFDETAAAGQIWDQVSALTLNVVIQAMTFNDAGTVLFAGTQGFGALRTDDVGSFLNWNRINNGLGNPWVYALLDYVDGEEYLFAGTWGGGVFRSVDSGETWQFVGLANRIVLDLVVDADSRIFAAADNGKIYRTVDNGLLWTELGVANTQIWSLLIDPATLASTSDDVIYAGTFGAGIYKSEDGGNTWVRTGLTDAHVFDMVMHGTDIFAATATGVKKSDDDGATWIAVGDGVSVASNLDPETLETRALAVLGDDLYAGTWGFGVFTFDLTGGSDWEQEDLPSTLITAFAIHPSGEELIVGSEAGGYDRLKLSSTTGTELAGVPVAYQLSQNYPNPFNPSTRFSFALPETGAVRLAVYNILGQPVHVLVDGVLPAGMHDMTFDAGGLPSGLYVYRLMTEAGTITRRMMLTK